MGRIIRRAALSVLAVGVGLAGIKLLAAPGRAGGGAGGEGGGAGAGVAGDAAGV